MAVQDAQIEAGGVLTWVTRTEGSGPAVVFVHSSGAGARQWRRFQLGLAGERRSLAPDLIATGRNAPWAAARGFDPAEDLAILTALIDAESGPVDLVGHSYGGFLALRAAVARPDRVRQVVAHEPVLWAPVWEDGGPAERMALFQASQGGMLAEEASGTEGWMRQFVDFWNGAGAFDALDGIRRASLTRVCHKVFAEVKALVLDRSPPSVWAPTCPVRLTVGRDAPWLERRALELAALHFGDVALIEVEGGHLAPMTHVDAWGALVRGWLDLST